jgi:hypothetical protein
MHGDEVPRPEELVELDVVDVAAARALGACRMTNRWSG